MKANVTLDMSSKIGLHVGDHEEPIAGNRNPRNPVTLWLDAF
jgi:hypothetical protein